MAYLRYGNENQWQTVKNDLGVQTEPGTYADTDNGNELENAANIYQVTIRVWARTRLPGVYALVSQAGDGRGKIWDLCNGSGGAEPSWSHPMQQMELILDARSHYWVLENVHVSGPCVLPRGPQS